MKITILVEGKTEQAFKPILREFLKKHLRQNMPNLDFFPYDGRIPTGQELKKKVETSLSGDRPSDHIIALSDVYTGSSDFSSAQDAKKKMRVWVGKESRFTAHVALHDFEAWLLPYWAEIQNLAGHNKGVPGLNPETVNHTKPPADHIKEIFRIGKSPRHYSKVRDAPRILRGKDLGIAISMCAELRAFVNTIIRLSGGTEIP